MSEDPARTKKQREIMQIILAAADQGEFLNVKQIHSRVSYTCAYGSIRTSMRFLVKAGVLARERAGTSSLMKPTLKAYELFRRT